MPYACQSVHHISDISDLAFPIGKAGIYVYGHENEMYNAGLNLKEVECL